MKTLALKNLCLKDKEPRVLTATQFTVTCSNSTIEILLKYVQGQWRHSDVFIVSFEHISHLFTVFQLLTLNKLMIAGYVVFNPPHGTGLFLKTSENPLKISENLWLTILTLKNLSFTEFSTKIHWNTRLAASDLFHVYIIN